MSNLAPSTPTAAATGDRVAGVDTIRAGAAVAVFLCHCGGYWPSSRRLPRLVQDLLATGAHGVDIFIVVSGFCLALAVPLDASALDIGKFAKRRALRIAPPYYLALVIAFALAAVHSTWRYVVAAPATPSDLLVHLLFVQNFFSGRTGTINGSLWSICLEAQLYLLFPLTLWLARRLGYNKAFAAAVIISAGWGLLQHLELDVVGSPQIFPARLVQFLAGMWCADRVRSGLHIPRRQTLALISISSIVAVAISTADVSALVPLAWTPPSIGLLLLANSLNETHGVFRVSAALGRRSYSFYLIHQPIVLVSWPILTSHAHSLWLQFTGISLLVLGLTWVAAIPLHQWVEVPSQSRARRVGASNLRLRL